MTPRRAMLGISAYYHDSAAALIIDGRVVAAAHEERFTRKKHDDSFPANAVRWVLDEYGLKPSDLAAVVFYDKPLLKFERLLEMYHRYAPRGVGSFVAAMPVWIKDKLFIRGHIRKELEKLEGGKLKNLTLLFPEHHLSHAASAFYPSPFDEAAILTVDGVGEWATTVIGHGSGKDISLVAEMRFPHSLGMLYSAFTYYCGFKINSGEYKLMGLAPYGRKGSARVEEFRRKIFDTLIDLKEDGSLLLNMSYFTFATTLRTVDDRKWEALFGIPPRAQESPITESYMDMALAIQEVTDEVMVRLARTAKKLTGSRNLVLAGGVALNCTTNQKIRDAGLFDRVWIQPAAGDAGGALGAALAAEHVYFDGPRRMEKEEFDAMQGAFLGPEYSELDVERMARRFGAVYTRVADEALYKEVAARIACGQVVGWMQGAMEWGPRALGNRSILADPRSPDMQKKLNLKIKYRESFRPFAPSVLEEDAAEYFETAEPSPYMLFVAPVKEDRRTEGAPADAPLSERLNALRSDIPCVTHLDYSARLQTVSKKTNPRYWALINEFKKQTGYGLVVNTSFNVRGEPIVMTPEDAYRCFMNTEMDCVVIGSCIFDKQDQPYWKRQELYGED
ncbi:MAG: carbamoyltransferase [Patescibacteria group bacterium]|nr:carbamoyltransferase [Patescibacteria group bacterium]